MVMTLLFSLSLWLSTITVHASTVEDSQCQSETVQHGDDSSSLLQVHVNFKERSKTDRSNSSMKRQSLKPNSTSLLTKMFYAQRKDIIWVHLHNFAGTTMCQEARRQGERAPAIGFNCNFPGDICSAPADKRVHCKQRQGKSFSSMERAVTDEDLECNDKLYGTMLREPLAGAKSTFVNNDFDHVDKASILSAMSQGLSEVSAHTVHKNLPEWDTYHHFDNFATRTLSGDYMIPAGMMERRHLDKAKSRLENMDVVLILEELGDHTVQLETMFGWNMNHRMGNKNSHSLTQLASVFTNEEEAELRRVNRLDYELYEFGKSLAANRSNAARTLLGLSQT
jgi:hypothetical protein